MKTLHLVVTTVNDGEQDNFADIIYVGDNQEEAFKIKDGLENKTLKDFDYDTLVPYDGVEVITRNLNSLTCWKKNKY